MICRCKNCGSAARFNPQLNKMVCSYCDSTFDANELDNREYIEYNVYSCSACGAELRMNGVEASTFCPYCGQPTIAYSRISKEVQPDVIVPFSVTKEEAIAAVREKFKRNIFIPKEIKNFDIDKIRGIYIPFWLFDVNYTGKSIIRTSHGSSKHRVYHYHYRHGECDFSNITADASKSLNDESSQRLEPFNLSQAVPFKAAYLSGFYADRYDVEDAEVEDIIKDRSKKYYEKAMLTSVSGSDKTVQESEDNAKLGEAKYAFLPVWFLTFRYKDKPYTFLINGQTKKVVGGVPFLKRIATALWAVLFAALLFPSIWVTNFLWNPEEIVKTCFSFLLTMGFLALFGWGSFRNLGEANDLTTSKETKNMVANREEEH